MSHKTDWFHGKKWGVFVHFLYVEQNSPGRPSNMGVGQTDWSFCVDGLDVQRLAAQLEEINAGYLFVTLMQRLRYLCAPNATFDRITGFRPGEACSRRDLIADIEQALSRRGIDLLLYFTGDGPFQDPVAGPALGYVKKGRVSVEFITKWADVGREYSLRYGRKVRGWWADGCYSHLAYDEPKLKLLADAMRAGNPDALIAMNRGVEQRVQAYSVSDDFTAGEVNEFTDYPDGRFLAGAQWHTLSFLGVSPDGSPGGGWCQPGSKYTGQHMREYVRKVNERGGVVTIDVCLHRDGHIDPLQLEVLRHLQDLR